MILIGANSTNSLDCGSLQRRKDCRHLHTHSEIHIMLRSMWVGVLVRITLSQFISSVTENVKILPCCLLGLEFFLLNLEDEVRTYLQWWILLYNQVKTEHLHLFHFQKQTKIEGKKKRKAHKNGSQAMQLKCGIYNLFITQHVLLSLCLNLLMMYHRLQPLIVLFSAKYMLLWSKKL